MRTKPLLAAAAALALGASGAGPGSRATPPAPTPAPRASSNSSRATRLSRRLSRDPRSRRPAPDESAGRRGLQRLNCRRRRRRSNIPAGRGATRASSGGSIPSELGLGADPWGGASGAFLSTLMRRMDTPIASRWAHIALRNALLAQGAGAAQRQSGRLGRRARLAAAADGRGRRRADAGRRGRHRPLHAEDVPGRGAERAGQRRSAGAVPAPGAASARTSPNVRAAGPGDVRVAGRRAGDARRRRSTMRAAAAGSAASTWRSPQKVVGAGADTGRAVTIEWEPVDSLTAWRFGLATATGMAPPDRLLNSGVAAACARSRRGRRCCRPQQRLELGADRGRASGSSRRSR